MCGGTGSQSSALCPRPMRPETGVHDLPSFIPKPAETCKVAVVSTKEAFSTMAQKYRLVSEE
jgi:hypothetical protein